MEKLMLGRGTIIYYDLDAKIIGRHPTRSNIKDSGSDNSLYMGLESEIDANKLICKIMGLELIDEFNGKSITMDFYGEEVEVQCNINKDGQLQYKIVGNGKMNELLEKYLKNIGTINVDKLLILLDFINNEIFFEESDDELPTLSLSNEQKKSKEELKSIVDECKSIKEPNVDVDGYIETRLNTRNNYVQKIFRNNLLVEFDGKCAICGINKKELLHASHILPYSKCSSTEEMIDYHNGLLLCINHDALFDKGFISFNKESGEIMISKEIDPRLYEMLNINGDIILNKKYLTTKRKEYLSKHELK